MQAAWEKVWPEWTAEKRIGMGSCGIVYKAVRETAGGREETAIKVIAIPQTEAETEALLAEGMTLDESRRYYESVVGEVLSEIRLSSSLQDKSGIVQILDYAVEPQEDGIGFRIFLRMDLLTPLPAWLADKTLSEEDVVRMGCELCRALEQCHGAKILHRDIKPENIFVDAEGHFKLGDFGIARRLENASTYMTRVGTPLYIAPEVASSRKYGPRADIYSLGLVLYRYLNHNRLPFMPQKRFLSPGDRTLALERRLSGEAIPAPESGSGKLTQAVLKACAYQAADRFPSAERFREALEKSRKAAAAPWWRRKWAAVLAVALIGLSVYGVSAYSGRKQPPAENPAALQETIPGGTAADGTAVFEKTIAEGTKAAENPAVSPADPATEQGRQAGVNESTPAADLSSGHVHSLVKIREKEPSCVENGWIRYECTECGEVILEERPALGHSFEGDKVKCDRCDNYRLSLSLNEDQASYTVTGYVGEKDYLTLTERLEIPDSYQGLPVTMIGARAFENLEFSKGLSLPSGLKGIEMYAFGGCRIEGELIVPGSCQMIAPHAFFGANPDNLVFSEGIYSIGDGALQLSGGAVSLPSTLASFRNIFGGSAAASAQAETLTLTPGAALENGPIGYCYTQHLALSEASDVYEIRDDCLIKRQSQTLVKLGRAGTLPDDGSLRVIGEMAVFNPPAENVRDGWRTLVIPEGVERLENNAIYSDTLLELTLPASLQRFYPPLGERLRTIRYGGTLEEWQQLTISYSSGDWASLAHCRVICRDGELENAFGYAKEIPETQEETTPAVLPAEPPVPETSVHEHSWSSWLVVAEAGCETEGERVRSCSGCGEQERETIKALGHDWSETIREPGCTESGFRRRECWRCGTAVEDQFTAALGHNYVDGVCTRCGERCFDYVLNADGKSYTLITVPGLDSERKLVLPDYYEGLPVTRIRDGLFEQARLEGGLQLPAQLEYIGERTFQDCRIAGTLIIPGSVKTIASWAFNRAEIDEIILEEGVETLMSVSFGSLKGRPSMVIPSSVRGDSDAFSMTGGSYNFTRFDTLTIDSKSFLDTIGGLGACTVGTLRLGSHVSGYVVKGNCLIRLSNKTLVKAGETFTIPDDGSVEIIAWMPFFTDFNGNWPATLYSIDFPEGVRRIEDAAYSSCIMNVSVPESLEFFDSQAFRGGCLRNIVYGGTKEKWIQITQENGEYWKYFPGLQVGCQDGTLLYSEDHWTEQE